MKKIMFKKKKNRKKIPFICAMDIILYQTLVIMMKLNKMEFTVKGNLWLGNFIFWDTHIEPHCGEYGLWKVSRQNIQRICKTFSVLDGMLGFDW